MKTIAAILLTAILFGFSPSAQAGTSPTTASHRMSQREAHSTAVLAQEQFVTVFAHSYSRIGKCTNGPLLWKCPVQMVTRDSYCTMTMWVWEDKQYRIYGEWHGLVCTARTHRPA